MVFFRMMLVEILKFVNEVLFVVICFIFDFVKLNCVLLQEGLSGKWGLYIGVMLEKQCVCGLLVKDFFLFIVICISVVFDVCMGGVMFLVMSNFGLGNQGIIVIMFVVVVVEYFGVDDEWLVCVLMFLYLSVIYIYNQLLCLFVFCVVMIVVMGVVVGMVWLVDGCYEIILMVISSMIGDVSGMICDGVLNSCVMKVLISVLVVWKVVLMVLDDIVVIGNEGIVVYDVEQLIVNLCVLVSYLMQ